MSKGKHNYFDLMGGLSYRGFELPRVRVSKHSNYRESTVPNYLPSGNFGSHTSNDART